MGGKVTKKLDYSIKNYEKRKEYVNNEVILENYNRKKWAKNGGADYNMEKISNYLVRSLDLERERDLDYSFFKDESAFWSRYRVEYNDKEEACEPKTIMINDCLIDKSLEYSTAIDMLDEANNGLISNLFLNELEVKNKRSLISTYKLYIDKIESYWLLDNIAEFFRMVFINCKNDRDIECVMLIEDGYADIDIAEIMGVTRQAVNKRINRILEFSM